MKYLKYTLLLITLLTFINVHAELCTYEESKKQAEKIDLSTFKYKYVKKHVVSFFDPPRNVVYKDKITGSIKLPNNYYVALHRDSTKNIIAEGLFSPLEGGVYVLKLYQSDCFEGIKNFEIFVPYFNPKSDNVWDDHSLKHTNNNSIILIITASLLVIITVLLIGYTAKYIKEY